MCIIHTFDSLPQICIDLSFDLPPMQYWKTGRLQNTAALQILGLQKLAGLLTSFGANLYSFYRTHHACLQLQSADGREGLGFLHLTAEEQTLSESVVYRAHIQLANVILQVRASLEGKTFFFLTSLPSCHEESCFCSALTCCCDFRAFIATGTLLWYTEHRSRKRTELHNYSFSLAFLNFLQFS